MTQINNLPEEIRLLPQWVCWCGDKVPKNPRTGGNAQSNNADSWTTFEQAIKACEVFGFDGVGFMFRKGGGYFGVDLDHCYENKAFCDEFVDGLQSYNEYSRSGTGLHIICKGTLLQGEKRNSARGVEMYSEGRYFICTGNIYNPRYPVIVDCTESIKPLHQKYLSNRVNKNHCRKIYNVSMNDAELIKQARASKNGLLFDMLYSGVWEGVYSSQSEADLALCNMLAFWSGCNSCVMDGLFRASGLMRSKWDERHGLQTYGEMTIAKAISGCSNRYEPHIPYLQE